MKDEAGATHTLAATGHGRRASSHRSESRCMGAWGDWIMGGEAEGRWSALPASRQEMNGGQPLTIDRRQESSST